MVGNSRLSCSSTAATMEGKARAKTASESHASRAACHSCTLRQYRSRAMQNLRQLSGRTGPRGWGLLRGAVILPPARDFIAESRLFGGEHFRRPFRSGGVRFFPFVAPVAALFLDPAALCRGEVLNRQFRILVIPDFCLV